MEISNEALTALAGCPALILAGGLGTRLRPVFDRAPKCMAPVGGRFFLEYLLDWLRFFSISDLILCVGHKNSQIQNWLGDGSRWGVDVRYSIEQTLLGTGGALKLAEKMVSSELCLVVNGDSFLDVNLQEMHRFHVSRKALATMAVAKVPSSERYGKVELDAQGKVTAFVEKRPEAQTVVSSEAFQLINGGVGRVHDGSAVDVYPNRINRIRWSSGSLNWHGRIDIGSSPGT